MASQIRNESNTNGFEDIHLLNNSLPELDWDEIDIGRQFLGKTLAVPIVINALTGGTEQALIINRLLSAIAAEFGLAMAVGSQTIAIDEPELRPTFSVVRDVNPNGLIFANISARSSLTAAIEAVDMIKADALQIHFNIPQELAMPEGDRSFRGMLANIRDIVKECPVQVIAKEVGFGFSRPSILRLFEAGIQIFDIGGKGGTNFVQIEDHRRGNFAGEFDEWGIPTAVSLAETISTELNLKVIASGGVRTAMDAGKALAMGADLVGIAGPFLKTLVNDGDKILKRRIQDLIYRLKAILMMTGSRNLSELSQQPLIILNTTAQWLEARGIDKDKWTNK